MQPFSTDPWWTSLRTRRQWSVSVTPTPSQKTMGDNSYWAIRGLTQFFFWKFLPTHTHTHKYFQRKFYFSNAEIKIPLCRYIQFNSCSCQTLLLNTMGVWESVLLCTLLSSLKFWQIQMLSTESKLVNENMARTHRGQTLTPFLCSQPHHRLALPTLWNILYIKQTRGFHSIRKLINQFLRMFFMAVLWPV